MEQEAVISKSNHWEKQYSDLHYSNGKDVTEVRIVYSRDCKVNGWRNTDGHEHWDGVAAWSRQLVKNNVGYRFMRSAELEDAVAMNNEKTPLILDTVGFVSDKQFVSLKTYLSKGGLAWLALPFGTHDEKGVVRKVALSDELKKNRFKNLVLIESAVASTPLQQLIAAEKFKPIIRQIKGDARWVTRIRLYNGKPVIHFMNTALLPVPHATLKDLTDIPILIGLESAITDNDLEYEINTSTFSLSGLSLMSVELNAVQRPVVITTKGNTAVRLQVNLEGVKVYAVAQ